MYLRLPRWLSGKESTCQDRKLRFDLWVQKIPWRRAWQSSPKFLPEESHGQRILPEESHGRGAWWAIVHGVIKESDMT